ncbi:MAG: hypothetical protein ACQETV_01845 [Actinomycetota bacterium]
MSEEELRRLLDEERAAEAARDRARSRRLREQAAEEGTLAGALRRLADQRLPVAVHTVAGARHQGVLVGVGADYCALRAPGGWPRYLALAAIASVRPAAEAAAVTVEGAGAPDRGQRLAPTLAEMLGRLAPERPEVTLRTGTDPDAVRGVLRSVGVDVCEVDLAGLPGRALVRLAAVDEVIVDPRA